MDTSLQLLAQWILDPPTSSHTIDDWDSILDLASQERVIPLLAYQLQRSSFDNIPHQMKQMLSSLAMNVAQRHFVMRDALIEITYRFEQAQIPVVLLKGMAIAYMVYPQPTLRPMGDHDIWVPLSHIERAYKLLQEMGFRERHEYADMVPLLDFVTSFYWSHHSVLTNNDGIVVELHAHILLEHQAFLKEYEQWFWEQQYQIYVKDKPIQTLNPLAMLLYLCAHMFVHHHTISLLNYLDVHYLVSKFQIDWAEVIEISRKLQWAWFVSSVLKQTKAYFQTPIPEEVIEALNAIPVPRDLVAKREAIYQPHTLLQQLWRDVQKVPFNERIKLFRQIFFPSLPKLKKRYHHLGWVAPLQYIYHWYWLLKEGIRLMRTPHSAG